jgi:hypothetical protein
VDANQQKEIARRLGLALSTVGLRLEKRYTEGSDIRYRDADWSEAIFELTRFGYRITIIPDERAPPEGDAKVIPLRRSEAQYLLNNQPPEDPDP